MHRHEDASAVPRTPGCPGAIGRVNEPDDTIGLGQSLQLHKSHTQIPGKMLYNGNGHVKNASDFIDSRWQTPTESYPSYPSLRKESCLNILIQCPAFSHVLVPSFQTDCSPSNVI